MAITLNGRTRLTTQTEKLMVELGGANPDKSLSKHELSVALGNAINALAEGGQSAILEKIYRTAVSRDPTLPALEDLDNMPDVMHKNV